MGIHVVELSGVTAKIEIAEAEQIAEERRREEDALLLEELKEILLQDKKRLKKVY